MLNPWQFLNDHAVKAISVECDRASVDIGGKALHYGPNISATVTRRGDVFRVDFNDPSPAVDLGLGVTVPIRLEISKAGVDAVGSRLGITKRQRLVLQEVP